MKSFTPNDEIRQVAEYEQDGEPGVLPVLTSDGRTHLTRRGFLGSCLKTALAVLLMKTPSRSEAPSISSGFPTVLSSAVETGQVRQIAGTGVNSDLLSMVGITEGPGGTIEEGFHLRWFLGSDLEPPSEAFPSDQELVDRFVNTEDSKDLKFGPGQSNGINTSVPPAFFLYCRSHFDPLRIDSPILEFNKFLFWELPDNKEEIQSLQDEGTADTSIPGVRIMYKKQGNDSELSIEFPTVSHSVDFQIIVQGDPMGSDPVLKGFLKENTEPMFVEKKPWVVWGQYRPVRLFFRVDNMRGGFHNLKFLWSGAPNIHNISALFSYMNSDTQIAKDPENPAPGEWVRIQTIPFITSFQNWNTARDATFTYPIKNRYLGFAAPDLNDQKMKLDVKYGHVFGELQKAFLRLKHTHTTEHNVFKQEGGTSLTSFQYEPFLLLQLWLLDPIMAMLLSHKFSDVPGDHNPSSPQPNNAYDYMITTAWQPVAQRLLWITQNVSSTTTPPVLSPKNLKGQQLDGFTRDANQLLYGVEIEANTGSSALSDTPRSSSEAPLFDVARKTFREDWEVLTQYVDPNAVDPKEQVIDTPIVATLSKITELSSLTPEQQLALKLEKILREKDPHGVITTHLVSKFKEFYDGNFEDNLYAEPPVGKFTDWLPAPPPKESKEIEYAVRGIDLFGRVSDGGPPSTWAEKTTVRLNHVASAPEVVDVRAFLRMDEESPVRLVVRWRLGARQVLNGGVVNHFNIAGKLMESHYVPKDSRQFSQWKDHLLKHNIPFKERVSLSILKEDVAPLTGSTIFGEILQVRELSGNAAASNEIEFLAENERVLTIDTNQCFLGVRPFVDLPHRYQDTKDLLDVVQLEVSGRTYQVIGFEAGEALRIQIAIRLPKQAVDPIAVFQQEVGEAKNFTLTFLKFITHKSWSQKLTKTTFPELRTDSELRAIAPADSSELTERVAGLEKLRLRVANPFKVDVTGREEWFTGGAEFQYQYAGRRYRVPIRDFEVISISAEHLRFGAIKINTSAPPTSGVTISNGGSVALTISAVTSSAAQFEIRDFHTPVTLSTGGSIRIEVTFTPMQLGESNGLLKIQTDSGSVDVILSGKGIEENAIEIADTKPLVPRAYLTELSLTQVVWEAQANSDLENPTPIFPKSLLDLVFDEREMPEFSFRISIPTTYQVIAKIQEDNTSGKLAELVSSCGGELFFITESSGNKTEVIGDVITRPSIPLNRPQGVSFLVQLPPNLPWLTVNPEDFRNSCFYPLYRVEIAIDESVTPDLTPTTVLKKVGIVVSTHLNEFQVDTTLDLDSLVSSPQIVQIPPQKPIPPEIPPLKISDPWVDPFEVDYTTLPKLLDNRKVVHYKVKLDDVELMKGSPLSLPESTQFEIFRCPEDALRVLTLEHMLLPIPTDEVVQNDLDLKEFYELEPDERYKKVFSKFNELSAVMRYQFLTTLLIRYWTHESYSLKHAFKPIGKITNPNKLFLIDEIENTAPGNIFYAIRSLRSGAAPSEMILLSFRVSIPNFSNPSTPTIVSIIGGQRKVSISWMKNKNPDLYRYDIFRSTEAKNALDIRLMEKVISLYTDESTIPSGAQLAEGVPFFLNGLKRRLSIERKSDQPTGLVNLHFPLTLFEITSPESIVGLYRLEKLPVESDFHSHDFLNDPENIWVTQKPSLSVDTRRIENLKMDNGENVAIVYRSSLDEIQVLKHVQFHKLVLESIPEMRPHEIKGVFPHTPLVVQGGKISLIFDETVHDLKMETQIVGIYVVTPKPRNNDKTGSQVTRNYWQPPKTWLDLKNKTINGINLPDQTHVRLEYYDSHNDLKSISVVLPDNHPSLKDLDFFGLIPRPLGIREDQDPPEVSREMNLLGTDVSSIKLKTQFLNQLANKSLQVKIRYGSKLIQSENSNILTYTDFVNKSTYYYRLVAVSKFRNAHGYKTLSSTPSKILKVTTLDNALPPVPKISAKWIDLDRRNLPSASTRRVGIEIKWHPLKEVKYLLQRRDSDHPRFTSITGWVQNSQGIVVDEKVNNKIDYTYRIKVMNEARVIGISQEPDYVNVSFP